MSVVIETTLGDITVDLYLEQRPRTCLNFLKQCKVKYYNLCVFHKVERNFIAQTGDPTETGRGGESVFCQLYGDQAKYFEAELKPRLKHEKLGTLSMVNNGSNMNGSQFFITLGENLTYLDEVHTVFGEVTEGFETLLKINEAICDPNDRPYQDIRITHTVILHDPFEDPASLNIPPSSPVPSKEQLKSNYIGADEEIDDTKGKDVEEIEEKIKESEAKARATILEMVGDIPDADVKPPENVLFVCKLNPVTTSEDLEVIFSRFGSIVSCEVIKDRKTGESLQYAFIEFEKEEDCESAYFKMDNVLIDDRRIHVDFSQSVSKMKFENDKHPDIRIKKPNFVIKEKVTQDKYDLILDSDENADMSESHQRKQKHSNSSHHHTKREYPRAKDTGHQSTRHTKEVDSSQRRSNSSNDNYHSKKKSRSPTYDHSRKQIVSHDRDKDRNRASSSKAAKHRELSPQQDYSRKEHRFHSTHHKSVDNSKLSSTYNTKQNNSKSKKHRSRSSSQSSSTSSNSDSSGPYSKHKNSKDLKKEKGESIHKTIQKDRSRNEKGKHKQLESSSKKYSDMSHSDDSDSSSKHTRPHKKIVPRSRSPENAELLHRRKLKQKHVSDHKKHSHKSRAHHSRSSS